MANATAGWVLIDKSPRVDTEKTKPQREAMDGHSHISGQAATHYLALVDEMITFEPQEYQEYKGLLRIQNISKDSWSIILKIKTTSPEHYRVTPTIAVIEAGGIAKVTVTSHPGVTPEMMRQDRFLVLVCVLPREALQDSEDESVTSSVFRNPTNFGNLNETFKRFINLSVAGIQDYKVAVCVEPTPHAAEKLKESIDEKGFEKDLENLKEKVIASLTKKLDRKLDCVYLTLRIVLVVLLIFVLIQLMQFYNYCWTDQNLLPADKCTDSEIDSTQGQCPSCGKNHPTFRDSVDSIISFLVHFDFQRLISNNKCL